MANNQKSNFLDLSALYFFIPLAKYFFQDDKRDSACMDKTDEAQYSQELKYHVVTEVATMEGPILFLPKNDCHIM